MRVVLVDDQPLLREGIVTILDAQRGIDVVGQASSGAEALHLVAETDPDVVCMDVEMPGMDGLGPPDESSRAARTRPEFWC